jgi:hypothetical protein
MRRPFNPNFPIVTPDFKANDQFRTWALNVDRVLPIYGEGSPEGVIPLDGQGMYIDFSASAGSNIWLKKQNNIGGDISLGWELA